MKILVVGETFYVQETHIKGVDTFAQARYVDESGYLVNAIGAGGHDVEHMPAHMVADGFPYSLDQLKRYDAIFVSDVGANSFRLGSDTTLASKVMPDRLALLEQYVLEGGGLSMIGGYMCFGGVEGKACYSGTPMEKLLPVDILPGDDRREAPAGVPLHIDAPDHPVFRGIPEKWPLLLGYNRLKAKPGALLASHDGNAIVAAWRYGRGRSLAFASDCAPHWAPPAFTQWAFYNRFWQNVAEYLAGNTAS